VTRLEQLRRGQLLSHEELAERTSLSAKTIRRLESGEVTRPHMPTVRALATYFDIPGLKPEIELLAAVDEPDGVAA
jgi:transcriptional regulator with XRE-family HTH domain